MFEFEPESFFTKERTSSSQRDASASFVFPPSTIIQETFSTLTELLAELHKLQV
jgi:hypothetical protein